MFKYCSQNDRLYNLFFDKEAQDYIIAKYIYFFFSFHHEKASLFRARWYDGIIGFYFFCSHWYKL